MNRTKLFFWTDTTIFSSFLIAASIGIPFAFFPGPHSALWKAVHLSSGIVVFTGVVFHLAMHRKWFRTTAKRLVNKANWPVRINFGVDFLLGWVFGLICLSGLNMSLSQAGYPTLFQIQLSLWETMHRGTGVAMTIYVIIHLALHYQWIKHAAGECFHYGLGQTQSFGLPMMANDQTRKTLYHK